MKILVVDRDDGRHLEHKEKLEQQFPNAKIKCETELKNSSPAFLDCQIMVLHDNNDEAAEIEEWQNRDFHLILFSGSEKGIYKLDEHWFAGFDDLDKLYAKYKQDLIS